MTWNELHELSTGMHGTSQHVLRHGVDVALKCDVAELRRWIQTTRGLSAHALCSVLDQHGIEVPAGAVAAVLSDRGPGPSP
jgi:hypothetical protein